MYPAWRLGSTVRAVAIAVVCSVSIGLTAIHRGGYSWEPWVAAESFTLVLGRTLFLQRPLIDVCVVRAATGTVFGPGIVLNRTTIGPVVQVADAQVVVILKSSDLERTIAWWSSIGFMLRGVHPPRPVDPTWCELERDGLVVQFLAGETPWPESPGFTGALYVRPHSVEAV